MSSLSPPCGQVNPEATREPAATTPAPAQVEPVDVGHGVKAPTVVWYKGLRVERPTPSKASPSTPAAAGKCAESLTNPARLELGAAEIRNDSAHLRDPSVAAAGVDAEPASWRAADWTLWLAAAWAASRSPWEARIGGGSDPDGDAPEGGPGAGRGIVWPSEDGDGWWQLDAEGGAVWATAHPSSAALSPSLDTEGISQQVLAATRLSEAELRRAVVLAELTAAYRDILARQHETIGKRLPLTHPGREWHLARARGWRTRWGRVVSCGASAQVVPKCGACGQVATDRAQPITCGTRECHTCRSARLSQLQAACLERCERAAAQRAPEMAGTHNGRGLGRWGWRFATLTVPPGRGVGADAREVRKAWARVWRKFCDHVAREGGEGTQRRPWAWSAVEATTGETRDGHVHVHALILGPFLSVALVRRWWGEALDNGREMPRRTAAEVAAFVDSGPFADKVRTLASKTRRGVHGRDCESVPWPVCDVRAVDGSDLGSAVREVAKYAVKDGWAEYSEPADLAKLAGVYCALARVRLHASSRWLCPFLDARPPWDADCECEGCGVVGFWGPEIRPRGPPGYMPDGYRCAPITAAAASAPRAVS